jgi:LL-diaminopimelate aminotransferase
VPWDDCGNFVRFSVTFSAPGVVKEVEIVEEIAQRLKKYEFTF